MLVPRANVRSLIKILRKLMENFLFPVQGQEKYRNIDPFLSILPFSTPWNFKKIYKFPENSRGY